MVGGQKRRELSHDPLGRNITNEAIERSKSTDFYLLVLENLAVVLVPDHRGSGVAVGAAAEGQRVPQQNLHKSWWLLYEGRWGCNKTRV